jgi:preprotein translocase subunit SecD
VQQQGANDITVTVPGKNAQQVVNLVGTTALLFFREVYLEGTGDATSTATPTPSATPTGSPGSTGTSSAKASGSPSSTPTGSPSAKASNTPSPSAAGDFGSPAAGQQGGQGLASQSRLLAAKKPKSSSSSTPTSSSSATPTSSSTASPTPATSTVPTPTSAQGDVSLVKPAVLKLFNQLNCNDKDWKQKIHYSSTQYDQPGAQIVSCMPASAGTTAAKFVLGPVVVNGTDVTNAQAGVPNAQQSLNTAQWQVNLSFNGRGSRAFGAITTTMNGKYSSGNQPTSVLDQLAVVLDGVVVSAPNIDEGAITGGNAQITGSFTEAQADTLANQLQYGALPINLHELDVESVSASLGRNQLVAGLVAAAIGLGLVVIYSFLYYRGLGLVSVSSLIIASLLAYLTVVMLSKYASSGFSLSLAGIAGLIVAIGITADSFVVFFERLRDEVRDGRSLRPAVESGWRRARRTILVSDTVSFLCALLLWYFSVSDVKGFAFTLGLTTLIDVIVVFLFTKPMVTLLAKTRFFSSGHPMSGLDPKRLGARAPWRSGIQRGHTRVNVKES